MAASASRSSWARVGGLVDAGVLRWRGVPWGATPRACCRGLASRGAPGRRSRGAPPARGSSAASVARGPAGPCDRRRGPSRGGAPPMRVELQAGAEIASMGPAEFREEMETILKRLGPLLEPKTILQYNCPKIVVPASGAV